jgi:hypothetical protein
VEDSLVKTFAVRQPSGSRRLRTIALSVLAFGVSLLQAQSTPTAAMKAYYDAAKKKDFKAVKALVSDAYLKELAEAPFSLERMMEPLTENLPPTMPPVRNEKVSGERAMLEVLDHRSKRWDTVSFVREQGVWKIALQEQN